MLDMCFDLDVPYSEVGVLPSMQIPYINLTPLVLSKKNIKITLDNEVDICSYDADVRNFIQLFDELDGVNGKYFSRRLLEIYADELDLPFDIITFRGLFNFTKNKLFDTMYNIALGIDDKGRPMLQQNFADNFIYVKFLSDDRIKYHLVYQNRDIMNEGTFNEFYKDFASCPVFS